MSPRLVCLFVCLCVLRGAGGGGLKEAEHAAEAAVRQRLAGAGQPRMRAAKTPEAKRIYAALNRRPQQVIQRVFSVTNRRSAARIRAGNVDSHA